MLVEEDPPFLVAILPGTFRQSVCTTYSDEEEGKTGVVQFCSFRKVPEQMEHLLTLFNVRYLPSFALNTDEFQCSLGISLRYGPNTLTGGRRTYRRLVSCLVCPDSPIRGKRPRCPQANDCMLKHK